MYCNLLKIVFMSYLVYFLRRQDPQIKKQSKSAKARIKRRLKKEKAKLQEPSQNTDIVHDAPMTE